jgi:hypothetical protein
LDPKGIENTLRQILLRKAGVWSKLLEKPNLIVLNSSHLIQQRY